MRMNKERTNMPGSFPKEATWLARLFKRPVYITRTLWTWYIRAPYDNDRSEWEPGETAVLRIEPDGTEVSLI
jgi:hypothetical protein